MNVRKLIHYPLALRLLLSGLLAIGLIPVSAQAAPPVSYYVSPTGSDANSGTSPDKPLQYIQTAANKTNPGDTVYVMNGTYWDGAGKPPLDITRSGAPNAYITYKAYPGHKPVIRVGQGAWNHIMVKGASYINIEGFEIFGWNLYLSNTEAKQYEDQGTLAYQAKFNTNGISVERDGNNIPHHINIRYNTVHHAPGAGIAVAEGDYFDISYNTVYSNCWFSGWGPSGISVRAPRSIDSNTSYKTFIYNNKVYDNITNYKWVDENKYSDGNGIAIDTNVENNYVGKTLINNNLVYENGGAGINIFKSKEVTVSYNTTYANSKSPYLNWGEIGAGGSSNVYVANNIFYSNNETVNSADDFTGGTMPTVKFDHNIFFNGAVKVTGWNNIVADPLFVNLAARDFHLKSNSPAVNSGDNNMGTGTDYDGISRPVANIVDRGAYEYH
ncbi:choice-of-anchor Q domain-containing protein [Paenibacillus sp. GCM10023252]|uniref:choice-of-anchor Q domain-containing protein n=1 Tax=Paenibacillus sp. GCM10023252 TaxID=3252649 RepID=UPI003618ADA2